MFELWHKWDIQHQQHLADVQARCMMPAERKIQQRKMKAQALANTIIETNIGKHY
ncbi:13182_t:CDS:2 [Cetraspora pellucida]|uniref:13182_t:CDS:1 n=1 Tax=Cetraspora pellucida TaxID=1433469 RepID=A0A9N8VMQ2_9GLOM|nr:13182_t:CDS:2 [Cetraspora pellucida]